jgi:hypothetical protein
MDGITQAVKYRVAALDGNGMLITELRQLRKRSDLKTNVESD